MNIRLIHRAFLCVAISSASLTMSAQATEKCGTMTYVEYLLKNNPQYEAIWEQLRTMSPPPGGHRGGGSPIITIPVVVHVVWRTAPQNISDAQILSQLDVLNEDFRRLNADTAGTWPVFKQFAADAQFEFCLAIRDPNNDSTTGITRTETTKTSFSVIGNEVKSDATGGKDAWPTDQYLNIWVCNIGGDTLGYAQFPGMGQPANDGVVIDYVAMGRHPVNPFGSQYRGRTATHEVGHWFNLRHIWGDDLGCDIDDEVDDTPLQTIPHHSCGSFNTCTDFPTDYNDMVQNYMNYSPDNCQNLFTHGQIARMHNALSVFRSSLHNSLGCYSVLNPPIVNFTTDATPICIGDTATFTDLSLNFPTAWSWEFPGGVVDSPNSSQPKVFYPSVGTYSVKLVASNVYGTDSLTKVAYVTVTGANDVVTLNESFENPTFPPGSWTIGNPNNDRTWTHFTTVGGFGESSSCMKFDNFSSPDVSGKHDYFISDQLDFTGLTDPYVTFDVAYAKQSLIKKDTLDVLYSTDCGQTFSLLWSKNGTALTTAPDQITSFVPTAAQWRNDSVSLSALAGLPVVNIAFRNRSGGANNLYIDNINISSTPSAAPVADFSAGSTSVCQGGKLTFLDESSNQPAAWQWSFSGGTPACTTCQDPEVTFDTPGMYSATLKVTNVLGADSLTKTNYITVDPAASVSISHTNVLCFGQSTGSATANVTGGTAPYTYAWSAGGTGTTRNSLSAGTHTVTVTDANGCKATKSVTIMQNQELVVNTSSTGNTGGGNGTATASAVGGVSSYAYKWNDPAGQTTNKAVNLYGGTYRCTVTDNVGCTKVVTVVVAGPPSGVTDLSAIDLQVYPNPTDGLVQVKIPSGLLGQLELVNVLGQQVIEVSHAHGRIEMSLQDVSDGIYLLTFRSQRHVGAVRLKVVR